MLRYLLLSNLCIIELLIRNLLKIKLTLLNVSKVVVKTKKSFTDLLKCLGTNKVKVFALNKHKQSDKLESPLNIQGINQKSCLNRQNSKSMMIENSQNEFNKKCESVPFRKEMNIDIPKITDSAENNVNNNILSIKENLENKLTRKRTIKAKMHCFRPSTQLNNQNKKSFNESRKSSSKIIFYNSSCLAPDRYSSSRFSSVKNNRSLQLKNQSVCDQSLLKHSLSNVPKYSNINSKLTNDRSN